jgi:hypothetical protein
VVGFTLLVGAVGVLLGGNVLSAVTGWELPGWNWRPVVLDLGVLGLLVGMVMAVSYDGPARPGALTRRLTVLLSTVTATLFLAAGMETLSAARTSLPHGVGALLAVLAGAILYATVRGPLERVLYETWAQRGESPSD